MPEMSPGNRTSVTRLILIPGAITLAVTILRLAGELQHWSPKLFNPAAGGGGAIIGIVWLVPIFGIYFALKLSRSGAAPASAGKAIGFAVLGLAVMAAGGFLAATSNFRDPVKLLGSLVLFAAAVAIQFPAWPALAKSLLAYGYAARVPVVVVMFFAIRDNWGTHYDGPPPNLPAMSFWPKYISIALLPQLFFWVAFTVIFGALFGTVASAISGRGKVEAPTTP